MTYQPPAIYGIIGNPVAHSLSPVMQNAAFKALGVNAVYKLFPLVDDGELRLFMEDIKEKANPIFGLNVTVPYKEKVLPYLDSLDPLARKTGAVNTLVIDHQRKIRGFNTDGPGFLAHLGELQFDPCDKSIIVLGAGGAARAIIGVLCLMGPQGPKSIRVFNRTRARVQTLIEEIQKEIDTDIIKGLERIEDLTSVDMLINTTRVGMQADDGLLFNPDLMHQGMLVYDVIYNPVETKLLQEAKQHSAATANGLGMLFYQGVLALSHWANVEPNQRVKKIMREALRGS